MAQRSEEVQRWSEKLQRDLMTTTSALCERLIKTEDPVEIDMIKKKAEAVGKVARTARSVRVVTLKFRPVAAEAPEDQPATAPETEAEPAPETTPKEEVPMNDRTDWTPERETALRAEVDRRLEKLYRSRECKGSRAGDVGGNVADKSAQPPADGAPSGSSD